MESGFFNPYAPISIHERKLPHWQQNGALYFITWRLADSIPESLMKDWTMDRQRWLAANPPPLSAELEIEYRERFPKRIETYLDQGYGNCLLRNPESRVCLLNALNESDFGGELGSFVIMPNHVHLVVKLRGSVELPLWVKSVKGRSARETNRGLGATGQLWQAGYWDRIVRNEPHLYRCRRYIERNPKKARLGDGEYELFLPKQIGL